MCEVVQVANFCLEGVCELAAARVSSNDQHFLLVAVYKPQPFSSSLEDHNVFYKRFSACLDRITKPNIGTVIVGDFNIDLSHSCIKSDVFTCMMQSYGLANKVKSYTREQRGSQSLIDHVYTDLPDSVFCCDVFITALSDHHGQVCEVRRGSANKVGPTYIFKRYFSDNNVQIFVSFLRREAWDDVLSGCSMNKKMQAFITAIKFYFDQAFPEKKVKVKPKSSNFKVALTQELAEMRERVRQWWYYTKDLHSSNEDRKFYLALKNRYRAIIRDAKSSAVHDRLQRSSNKTKTVWDIINGHRNTGKALGVSDHGIKNIDGSSIKDPKAISNLFCDFFINISNQPILPGSGHCTQSESTESVSTGFMSSSFFLTPVSESEVADIIRSLKPKMSAGNDNMSSKLLKLCYHQFIYPLVHLINYSFETGSFLIFLSYLR